MDTDRSISVAIMNLAVGESVQFTYSSPEELRQLQTIANDLRDAGYDLWTSEEYGCFSVEAGDVEEEEEEKEE